MSTSSFLSIYACNASDLLIWLITNLFLFAFLCIYFRSRLWFVDIYIYYALVLLFASLIDLVQNGEIKFITLTLTSSCNILLRKIKQRISLDQWRVGIFLWQSQTSYWNYWKCLEKAGVKLQYTVIAFDSEQFTVMFFHFLEALEEFAFIPHLWRFLPTGIILSTKLLRNW